MRIVANQKETINVSNKDIIKGLLHSIVIPLIFLIATKNILNLMAYHLLAGLIYSYKKNAAKKVFFGVIGFFYLAILLYVLMVLGLSL